MKVASVAITCVILSFLCLFFLSEVHRELNGSQEQQKLTRFWQRKAAIEHLNLALHKRRFQDFKQSTALLIPEVQLNVQDDVTDTQLRQLASVIPHEKLKIEIGVGSADLIKKGKSLVVAHKYKEGIQVLHQLLDRFPDSHHCIEAHYLILESQINLKNFDKAIEVADGMVDIYPENRLTGYALLKLGGVYERQDRLEDALQIYRVILSAFEGDANLMNLAQKSVKLLEL